MQPKKCTKIVDKEECEANKKCIYNEENKEAKCRKRPTKKIEKPISKKNSSMKSFASRLSSRKSASSPTAQIINKTSIVEEKESSKHLATPILPEVEKESSKHLKTHIEIEDPCLQIDELQIQLRQQRKKYDDGIQKCEEYKHAEFITKYFGKKKTFTHKDLLDCLMEYYKEQKARNNLFVFTFQDFINMFPRDKKIGNINFKKQHVFEAICRLLLLYNYDDGELGRDKTFCDSLESVISGNAKKINDEILDSDINAGNKAGLVDILFNTNLTTNYNETKKWACELKTSVPSTTELDSYIMIQNKYYDIEKSNIGNYDVTRMYALFDLYSKHEKVAGVSKIVLMVNNEDALSNKFKMAKQQYPNLIYKIYGITNKLNDWFQTMVYELKNSGNLEQFLKNKGQDPKLKPTLKQRFHQLLITRSTMEYINAGHKRFIWGAVPRSGKTYMIGGLISDRNISNKVDNNIVLILGAKTETLGQFKNMFTEFDDFKGYKLVIPDDKEHEEEGERNIYLFSQEYLKDKMNEEKEDGKIISAKTTFKPEFKFKSLLECNKKIDLYFDEIHKGGTTDRSESILYAFKNTCIGKHPETYSIIDLFVMVTATFAKPNIKYKTNFIDEKSVKVLQWSYDDQQNMKYVTNDTKMQMMITSREGVESSVLNNLFQEYRDIYGHPYLSVLSNEYKKHPELVLISPFLIPSGKNILTDTDDVRNVIKTLKCNACKSGEPVEFYREPSNIFIQEGPITDLLNFIGGTVYNHFQSILNYPMSSSHTQLWFLPDKDLYDDAENCKQICKPVTNDISQDEESNSKTGIPNIEPLTRGLAFKIIRDANFDKYNVLIIHGTNLTYLKPAGGKDIYENSGRIKHLTGNLVGKEGLADQIRKFEKDTHKVGKSLIILTGAKLRLGISLPCADIAFNFDNVSQIDFNYQTMFRVLTECEAKNKKYGYYLDFNKSRSIKFLYEYNKIYGESKKSATVEENVEALQSLLFTFNYNGLGLMTQTKTNDDALLYATLMNELKDANGFGLNKESYINYWTQQQNLISLIKKNLALTGNAIIINKLSKLFGEIEMSDDKPGAINTILKEGELRNPTGKYGNNSAAGGGGDDEDEDDEDEDEEGEEDEDDYGKIMQQIASVLPSIVVLLGLFSEKQDNLLDSLEKNRNDIDELQKLCSCETIDDANILDCFLNSPVHNFSKEKLIKIVDLLILLLNDENNDLLRSTLFFIFDNVKDTMKGSSDCLIYKMSIDDVKTKIQQYLSVRVAEKEKYGEVFTPIELINEMLDKLPSSVWKDPTLTWLDPANGIGNFPMVVYKRLMDKLPDSYDKDHVKYSSPMGKSNHILKHMLYMCEINSKNVKISKQIFGPNANICCCDFLNEEVKWRKQFGRDKFDIIIGNPPFQTPKKEDTGTTAGKGTLWNLFITKSLDFIVESGFLGFITPPPWRKPESDLYKLMTKDNQLLYLHIYNKKQGQTLFHVSQRVDLYVIEKTPKYKNTQIVDEQGEKIELDLSKWVFLPNYAYKTIQKIMTSEEEGIDIIYNTFYHSSTKMDKTKKEKNIFYKYPVVHGITQDGLGLIYSNDKIKGHFGVSKVLLNANENQYPVNDYDGKYGMSELSFGIPITSKKQGDCIVEAINTDDFKEIIKATKWGSFQTDYKMFKYFRPDFYKDFLGKTSSCKGNPTKIQAVVRGRQTRKKIKAINTIKDFISKYTRTKKGGSKSHNRKTRKMR
jgi:hypothetical protein